MSTRTHPTLLKALCCCFHQVVPSSDPLICWRNPQNPFCVWFHWWFNPSVDYTIDKPLEVVKPSKATNLFDSTHQSIKPLKIVKPSSINPPIPIFRKRPPEARCPVLISTVTRVLASTRSPAGMAWCGRWRSPTADRFSDGLLNDQATIGSCSCKETYKIISNTSNLFIVLGFRKLRWSVIFAQIETIQWKTSNVYRLGLSDSAPCREVFAALPGSMPYHFCCRDWTTTSSWLSSVWPLAC